MTPPRDPDSGRGRVPHRDHAREVTRPGPHVDDTLAGWGDARGMLAVVCSFLSACAEARRYSRGREPSENADLWPEAVGTWAESVSDELSMIEFELAQGGDR